MLLTFESRVEIYFIIFAGPLASRRGRQGLQPRAREVPRPLCVRHRRPPISPAALRQREEQGGPERPRQKQRENCAAHLCREWQGKFARISFSIWQICCNQIC